MNLSTEPWIPAVWRGGAPATVTLREVFERGHELQDLAALPHQRVAIMRLLICVAQAALDGPTDRDDWEPCRLRIGPAAIAYLDHWKHAFELFGSGQRFLQVANLARPDRANKPGKEPNGDGDEGSSASKLDLALATGNNVTLFDNVGESDRELTPGDLALNLLTFQCFSPSGTIGVALWGGLPSLGWSSYPKVKPGQSEHAPCVAGSMLHALLRSDVLLDSVHDNMMTKGQVDKFFGKNSWGRPVWEMMPQRPTDDAAVTNASRTYLGRLVPLTRAVRLADDGRSILLANGLEYASYPSWREPSATVVTREVNGQPDRQVLRASLDKAAWRELHALTVRTASEGIGGPAALQYVSDERAFDLWVGGLVADKAKLVDTTESVFHIPAEMLGEPGRAAYEKGVRYAERTSFRLWRAVSLYHKELGDNLDRPEMKKRRWQIQHNSCTQFWTDVESALPCLLEVAANPAVLGLKNEWHKTGWGASAWRAARNAYERACPHVTPRQIRAYAIGLGVLFTAPAEGSEEEKEKEIEE